MFINAILQGGISNDGGFDVGVTLLVALATRHLAVMFSLGESKRDTRGVVAVGERGNFKKIIQSRKIYLGDA